LSKAPGAFNPVTFWSGQQGGFWDFTNSANLFSDSARTTPASIDGAVKGVTDLSGLGNHLADLYGSRSFTRKTSWCEASAAPLEVASFSRTASGYTSLALFRPTALSGYQYLVDMPIDASNTSFVFYAFGTNMAQYVDGAAIGDTFSNSTTLVDNTDYFSSSAVNDNNVSPIMSIRVAGVTQTGGVSQTMDVAPGRLSIGAAGESSSLGAVPFVGRLYCVAWINKACTAQEILDIGNYMNSLTGVSATI
jgi:hypothetical protein